MSVFSVNSPDFFPPHYPDRSIKAVQLSRILYEDVRRRIWHSKWVQLMQQARSLGKRDLGVKQEDFGIKIQPP